MAGKKALSQAAQGNNGVQDMQTRASVALENAKASLTKLEKEALAQARLLIAAKKKQVAARKAATSSVTTAAKKRAVQSTANAVKRVKTKVAATNARIRTARAKLKASQTAHNEELQKAAQIARREEDLQRALSAFVTKWNVKRDRKEATEAAKAAHKALQREMLAARKAAKRAKAAAKKVAGRSRRAAQTAAARVAIKTARLKISRKK